MTEPAELVLASRSPQRRAILELLGVPHVVSPSGAEELASGPLPDVVIENARRKARAVPGELVLGVDTDVVLEGEVFGKPGDAEEARALLTRLAGRTHEVWSGLALREGGRETVAHAVTAVRVRKLDAGWIDWYVGTGEWRERAGGYAIQGRGAALVEGIEGDYWNVVGLPVAELVRVAPWLVRAPRGGRAAR